VCVLGVCIQCLLLRALKPAVVLFTISNYRRGKFRHMPMLCTHACTRSAVWLGTIKRDRPSIGNKLASKDRV
jgi:hypothetical protein